MSLGRSSTLTEVLTRSAGADITSPPPPTYHVTTDHHQQWFSKINDAGRFPDLFVFERQGLALLEATDIIRVPRVIACENVDQDQVLVLEWIDEGLLGSRDMQQFQRLYKALTNHRQQRDIRNLYPLLIHLNLFGETLVVGPFLPLLGRNLRSARLYKGNILHTIQRF